VLDVAHVAPRLRHDAAEQTLALQQRQAAQVPAVQPEQIEGKEVLRRAAAHERKELRLAVAVEMNDFAVKNGVPAAECRADGGRQLGCNTSRALPSST
jgi:hypothetical protein